MKMFFSVLLWTAWSRAVKVAQCRVLVNYDYLGGDIGRVSTPTAEGCCDSCANKLGCAVGVFYQGVCYMKDTGATQTVNKAGRIAFLPGSLDSVSCPPEANTDYECQSGSEGCELTTVSWANATACWAICEGNSACEHAVFFPGYQNTCYLKGPGAEKTQSSGRTACTPKILQPRPPPNSKTTTEWTMTTGDRNSDPKILLSINGSEPRPFQLRGYDYSPISKCCGNNDASVFQKELYTRDIPRIAASGANAIKLYGMCDGVLDASNYCGAPRAGCTRKPVTVQDVLSFLDFCWEHRVFVLLANRNSPGNVEAYDHMARTYGSHPATAGVILYDEALDMGSFNQAAQAARLGFAAVLGKNPRTSVLKVGRIITTAMLAYDALPSKFNQVEYGREVNVWGFDPYAQWDYGNYAHPTNVPFKPYVIMENGLDGAGNWGCRIDCGSVSGHCRKCSDFKSSWPAYVSWLETARLAGNFVFEWTDENWKSGGNPCQEAKSYSGNRWPWSEANHGILAVNQESGALISKGIGNGETFETVIKASWTKKEPGTGGFRGWL